jgi:hypothetical protein
MNNALAEMSKNPASMPSAARGRSSASGARVATTATVVAANDPTRETTAIHADEPCAW